MRQFVVIFKACGLIENIRLIVPYFSYDKSIQLKSKI
jgi:hypothetical protein